MFHYDSFNKIFHPTVSHSQDTQNSTHLYAICGTNFIQRYTSFLKIYRMLSGKKRPTMIKCTGNRTAKSTHSDKIYQI